ncbi:MAG: ROK family transcriptional regulator [Spirochaetales bacterium]|nr:ROK family transcriptional regulator [Spirochaetales bacterium]
MIKKPRVENTSRILRSLWISKSISRIEIARELGLNKSTITDIVSQLIEQGIVLETKEGSSSPLGGRKPVQLELNKKYGYVLGIELTSDRYTIVAVDLAGDILFSKTEEDTLITKNFEERIVRILKKYPPELEWIGAPVIGAGIGMSGIINTKTGVIQGSIALKIENDYDFANIIGSQFDFPVFVENDANSCAWGELAFHRSEKLRNFIFTLVEFNPTRSKELYENVSVGFGIVFGGHVYYGNGYSAGEFHSIFCNPEDLGQFRISSQDVKLDDDGDKLREFIKELSKHLALFTNTFNLGQIFLGGDIEQYQDIARPILTKAIKENWMYKSPIDCEIRFSSLANKSVAYGAAGMVLERLFEVPESISQ